MALSAYSAGDRVILNLPDETTWATVITPNDLAQHAPAGFDAVLDSGRTVYVRDTNVVHSERP